MKTCPTCHTQTPRLRRGLCQPCYAKTHITSLTIGGTLLQGVVADPAERRAIKAYAQAYRDALYADVRYHPREWLRRVDEDALPDAPESVRPAHPRPKHLNSSST